MPFNLLAIMDTNASQEGFIDKKDVQSGCFAALQAVLWPRLSKQFSLFSHSDFIYYGVLFP